MVSLLIFLHYALWIYMLLVIARVLLSWVNPDPYNPVVRFLHQVTDPVLYYIRRTIPMPRSTLDFSPIILLILITFVDNFIMKSASDLAMNLPVALFGNLLYALVHALRDILRIYMIILIVRAVISWVNPDPYNFIVRFLYDVTDPVLYRVRRILPVMGGLDFSPIIVIIAILLLDRFLLTVLL